jgi:hypothetical protein
MPGGGNSSRIILPRNPGTISPFPVSFEMVALCDKKILLHGAGFFCFVIKFGIKDIFFFFLP